MLRFCATIRHWLIVLLLGTFSFQALAASASELCRLQCQKDWKTNTASIGNYPVDAADSWSQFSTPCPDLPARNDSAPAEANACKACGMCALNTAFAMQRNLSHVDVKHPPRPVVEQAQAQAWVNDGLFKPPRI